jgi:archaellum biogenesis ATPase FlaH/CheY-like chemotaxis protein
MSRILVVDDDSSVGKLLSAVFSGHGIEVAVATDGIQGFKMACENRPDVILLDIWMPNQDGLEALKTIKEHPDTKAIPVVMLSGMPVLMGEFEAFHLGASHYVTKPWDMDTLKATIRVALNESQGFNESTGGSSGRDSAEDDPDQDYEAADPTSQVITTGGMLTILEQKLEGGLPWHSVTLLEGASSTGKSVLSQYLVYGSLTDGLHTSYFTSQHTETSLVKQMRSMGLEVSRYVPNQLRVYELPQRVEDELPEPLLATLLQHIHAASMESDFVVLDSITGLAASCSEGVLIDFFMSCKRAAAEGATMVISVDSYAFGAEMFSRLGTMCDSYFTLKSEKMRNVPVKTLEILKFNTTELSSDNSITFVVEPKTGMRIMPYSKKKI